MPTKRAKGSVRVGETGQKALVTQHAGWKSVSEKSQTTRPRNKPLRNQKARQSFSFVKSRTNGLMVLSSSLGGVTIQTLNMIRGML